MRKVIRWTVLLAVASQFLAVGQTNINGGRGILGTWDASAASATKPAKAGATLPATCSVGEQFFHTAAAAGQNLYLCAAPNVWTQIVGGSGGGGGAPTTAKYILQEADGSLANAQALSGLSTGLVKNTTGTGVLSIATGPDLPSHTHGAADVNSGTLGLARGGTGSDLSATGGAGKVLKQTTAGGAVTVAEVASTELTDSGSLERTANKNVASGYAGLDAGGRIAKVQAPAAAVYTDSANAFTAGAQDFSGAGATLPVKAGLGANAPASCVANKELYLKTDATAGQQLFVCNASGAGWNLVGDGGTAPNPPAAKGDLWTHNGAGPQPLSVSGVSGRVLAEDSSQTTGLAWKAVKFYSDVHFPAAARMGGSVYPGAGYSMPTTGGATGYSVGSGAFTLSLLQFGSDMSRTAYLAARIPSSWDAAGGVQASLALVSGSSASGTARFTFTAACFADGADVTNPAWAGSPNEVTQAVGAMLRTYYSSPVDLTLTGDCAAGRILIVNITRTPGSGGDNYGSWVGMIGLRLRFKATSLTE